MRRRSVQRLEDVRKHRSSELYVTFKDLRRRFEKEAEQQNKEMTKEWQKQGEFHLARLPEALFLTHMFFFVISEEKAKRLDEQRRETARKARKEYDEYRRSLVATTRFVGKAMVALNRIREQRLSIKGAPRYS